MILEREIEQYLRLQVQKLGGRAIKFTSSNLRALPDRLCLFPGGLIVFVEVKRPGRKPSTNQQLMIKLLRSMGFIAVWLDGRPAVDALLNWLKEQYPLLRPSQVRNDPQARQSRAPQ